MTEHQTRASVVIDFLQTVARGGTSEELRTYLHADFVQRELPSLVKPWVAERGLTETMLGAETGRQLLSGQRYDVDEVLECDERVILQLRWTGVLATGFQGLEAGDELRAHVALFATVRDGLIVHQASYDCYESLDDPAQAPPLVTREGRVDGSHVEKSPTAESAP